MVAWPVIKTTMTRAIKRSTRVVLLAAVLGTTSGCHLLLEKRQSLGVCGDGVSQTETGPLVVDVAGHPQPTALHLNQADTVYISFYIAEDDVVGYATKAPGATWQSYDVIVAEKAVFPVLGGDARGMLHLSYYSSASQSLRYATNTSGSWNTKPVDAATSVVGLSLAVDDKNAVHLSYMSTGPTAELKYATNASGSWDLKPVHAIPSYAGFSPQTSLAVDANGHVHIAYDRPSTQELSYTTNALGEWKPSSVNHKLSTGTRPSLRVDGRSKAHISYQDNGSLMYATNASGSWQVYPVDAEARVGEFSSLGLDRSGNVHIAYYDHSNGDLKYATNASGSWQKFAIDSAQDVGAYPSIGVDSKGTVHIVYFDATGRVIKYVIPCSTPLLPI